MGLKSEISDAFCHLSHVVCCVARSMILITTYREKIRLSLLYSFTAMNGVNLLLCILHNHNKRNKILVIATNGITVTVWWTNAYVMVLFTASSLINYSKKKKKTKCRQCRNSLWIYIIFDIILIDQNNNNHLFGNMTLICV